MPDKILIIEDDDFVREDIEALLEIEKFKVQGAEDGRTAIAIYQDFAPDLVLCDIMLPDIDGYEVFDAIKQLPKRKPVPFIFLTAKAEREEYRKGMRLGADDYITKPYKSSDLLDAIRVRLNKNRREMELIMGSVNQDEEKALSIDEYLFVQETDDYKPLKVADIECIIADDIYTDVYSIDSRQIKIRKRLKDWESILPNTHFQRIHKSTLINLNHIVKIDKWFNNALRAHMKTYEEPLIISRRHAAAFKDKMYH